MATPPPPLDPTAVLTAIFAALVGEALAPQLGAYAVILVAATTGTLWALGRRPPDTAWKAVLFVVRMNLTAGLVTVGLAKLAQWGFGFGQVDIAWLLAPIALLVGAIGDDWPELIRWALARLGRLIERRTSTGDAP